MPASFPPTSRFPSGLLAAQLDAGEIVVRIHRKGQGAIFFGPAAGGPPQNRFDAPAGEYGVLYAARRLEGAFVETLLRRPAGRIVRRAYIEERQWTPIRIERQLTLAKIMDEGLLFHGVDASVSASDDYGPSRALALDLFNDFPSLDGLAYRSRHNNGEICYALFDRVASRDLAELPSHLFENNRTRVDELMGLHGAILDDSAPV
ncbi:RES family NAD+ phosphorylase [uncultured Devosia sp.]|uniref:RES family NAD+ phosphorylase n=1 Tax=uncultured Devosia sp. TaxID=211434 RepID=UPI002624F36D|nr:RES family NAD+ phosphorylase [uncultured Devosia sp.]